MQLIWFRNDLRTDDNPLLHLADPAAPLMGVYFFDPRFYTQTTWGFPRTGSFRAQFLRQTVSSLRESLGQLGIPLVVYHGRPEDVLPELCTRYDIERILVQREWTRDEKRIEDACRQAVPPSVQWTQAYGQFLFHPSDLPYSDVSAVPEVFTEFRKACERKSEVQRPVPPPAPHNPPRIDLPDTRIPSLADLGLEEPVADPRSAFPFAGGEQTGMQRLKSYFWETRALSTYKKTRNGLLGTEYSSKFSPWLAAGALSPRRIYWEVRAYESKIHSSEDTYWMIFELIWRDYFKYVSLKHGDAIFRLGGILNREYDWGSHPGILKEWMEGRTREPFVNANMRELAATGWISNRGRQNVASYWAKQLKQDWRIGASWFESQLLDYDVHSNWGNWMYNSGVGNDPRDRIFNIRRQAEQYDSSGKYQRLWLQDRLL